MSDRLKKAKAAVEAAKDHQQGTQTWVAYSGWDYTVYKILMLDAPVVKSVC